MDRDPIEDRLCLAIYHASHAMTAAYRTILQPLKLTYPQYTVMSALWRIEPRTVKSLGQVLGTDSNTVSPLLKRLEQRDLVTRSRGATDEREVLVRLTEVGRELAKQAESVQDDIQAATGLDPATHARLVRDLQALTRNLEAFASGG